MLRRALGVTAAGGTAAGFYAYPTDKSETSGIALMKAQSCGCIPVTSGKLDSATPETCGEFDLGPAGIESRLGRYIMNDPEWRDHYVERLLAAATRPREPQVRRARGRRLGTRRRSVGSHAPRGRVRG